MVRSVTLPRTLFLTPRTYKVRNYLTDKVIGSEWCLVQDVFFLTGSAHFLPSLSVCLLYVLIFSWIPQGFVCHQDTLTKSRAISTCWLQFIVPVPLCTLIGTWRSLPAWLVTVLWPLQSLERCCVGECCACSRVPRTRIITQKLY